MTCSGLRMSCPIIPNNKLRLRGAADALYPHALEPYAASRYHGYPLRRPAVLKTCVRTPEGWAVIRSELTTRTVTANFSSNPWPRIGAGTWKTGAWRHIYC